MDQKCLVTKPQVDPYNVYTTNVSYFYDPTTKKCVYGQGSTGFSSEDECTKACVGTETTSETVVNKDQIKVGFKFSNGLEILKEPISYENNDKGIIIWLPTQDGGSTGNEFSCARHENGKYYLYPSKNGKYTLTKNESKALYDKYCQSSSNYVGELCDFIVPIFPSSGNNSLADNTNNQNITVY